jgi:hypothetical protein
MAVVHERVSPIAGKGRMNVGHPGQQRIGIQG